MRRRENTSIPNIAEVPDNPPQYTIHPHVVEKDGYAHRAEMPEAAPSELGPGIVAELHSESAVRRDLGIGREGLRGRD